MSEDKKNNGISRKLVLRSKTSTELQLLNAMPPALSLAGGGHIGSGSARRPEKPGQRGCASRVPESQNQPGCGWADASCTGTRKWSQCRQGAAACARYRGPQEAHTYASGPRCAPGRPRGVSAGGLGRVAGLRRRQVPGSHWFDRLHQLRGRHVLCCCGGHSCLHLCKLCPRQVLSSRRFDRLHRLRSRQVSVTCYPNRESPRVLAKLLVSVGEQPNRHGLRPIDAGLCTLLGRCF